MNTEEELIAQLKEAYIRYRNKMYQCAYNICLNRELAEDIVQNVFVRLIELKNIGKIVIHMDGQLYHLLLMLTNWTTKNLITQEKRRCDVVEKYKENLAIKYGEINHIEKYLNKLEYEEIKNFLLDMPELYSQIMYMKLIFEMTTREIAAILEMKEKTVQKRFERGKNIVCEYFQENHSELLNKLKKRQS